VALVFALAKLLSSARPEPKAPTADDLQKARAIAEDSPTTLGYLALLGDKELLFSDNGNAFIMYGIAGRSWVALGDPVGPVAEAPELVWRFREMSDRHDGWTVFYQVAESSLKLYVDLGLSLIKLGENAYVPLADFNLDGHSRKTFRHLCNKFDKDGVRFELVGQQGVAALLGQFRQVSDAWLTEKRTREKSFSIGHFNPDYLARFPAAVIRGPDGQILAFANVLLGGGKEEMSVDLMRYTPAAPGGVMDFLFVQLMLWGRTEGYRWFDLGMAPLSGLDNRQFVPTWNRLGTFLFRQGDHFYNFQGLRRYKEKFDPQWRAKYLACPGGLVLPRILAHIASLSSGGIKGVVAK
jgi:phosphatidylglycerol lysyltransferase